jgi:ElaB/YqjD/DUF883 family membrane-anchored ribosome-binding protein
METTDKATNSGFQAFDKIASRTAKAAETLGEKRGQLKDAERRLMGNCCAYVRDKPITSLSIAVAAGFLLSRVLSGR